MDTCVQPGKYLGISDDGVWRYTIFNNFYIHFRSLLSLLSRSIPASNNISSPGARISEPVLLGLVDPPRRSPILTGGNLAS